MATMLLSLGKQVTMVTDKRGLDMNRAIIDEAVRTGGKDFKCHIHNIKNNLWQTQVYDSDEIIFTEERELTA